ncbi:CcmD family protein [Candidatus Binatia bacterium]|jgi:CcmD family protein|nr:CcmD family protein [Candidatus Binatia bacterium]
MKGLYYLTAAYTAVWVAIFAYLMSIGRRARKLEREIEELKR